MEGTDRELLHDNPLNVKIEPMEDQALASTTVTPQTSKTESSTPRWQSPTLIRTVVEAISLIAFSQVLWRYMQYTREHKSNTHENCMANAQILYERGLAQCNADAARRLRGGALGMNWLEAVAAMVLFAGCQYLVWLAQGWLIVRICFIMNKNKA
ncbi:hypothetical protein LTR41_003754 [Exophiala xenobiotica]|nr:hypothetical protein LTR41_003754 [Exophiala xenobiotica]